MSLAEFGEGLQRVALLKSLEERTKQDFISGVIEKESDESLRKKINAVVLESNLAGIVEFSDEWFFLIKKKMSRMQLMRDMTLKCLQTLGDASGFDSFERALIIGCCNVSTHYDDYYLAYLKAIQEKQIVEKLKESPPDVADKAMYCSYTIVSWNSTTKAYETTPFALFFKDALKPILDAMTKMVEEMRGSPEKKKKQRVDNSADRQSYIDFFEHYIVCHSAVDKSADELEQLWADLDRKWMDCKGDIQIVHDIETGYGDPLRVKATPDFSLRFLDDTYAKENETIAKIQTIMESYFKTRNTPIANNGLTALSNTLAGIYYIPFKTGISLQFSFSGQSIPNRQDVATEKGIKIYFDAVETKARIAQNINLIEKCFANASDVLQTWKPDAVEQLVDHVAAHEVGHAIYNLESVKSSLHNPSVTSLLEEPRAELTAMFTLKLLSDQGVINLPHTQKALIHFALDALRYFAKFKSEALQPYIYFQIYAYKVYLEKGFLVESPGGLEIDASKTMDCLEVFSSKYLEILDCEDKSDGDGLQQILDHFKTVTPFVQQVVDKVLM